MQSSFPWRRQDQNPRDWSTSVNIWPQEHHVEHSISNWLHCILFSASLTHINKDTNSCTISIYIYIYILLTDGSSVFTAGTETLTSSSDLECSGMLYSYCDKDTTEHDWNSRNWSLGLHFPLCKLWSRDKPTKGSWWWATPANGCNQCFTDTIGGVRKTCFNPSHFTWLSVRNFIQIKVV